MKKKSEIISHHCEMGKKFATLATIEFLLKKITNDLYWWIISLQRLTAASCKIYSCLESFFYNTYKVIRRAFESFYCKYRYILQILKRCWILSFSTYMYLSCPSTEFCLLKYYIKFFNPCENIVVLYPRGTKG